MQIILFDLMNTLLVEPYHQLNEQYHQRRVSPELLRKLIEKHEFNTATDESSDWLTHGCTFFDIFYYYKNRECFHEFERGNIEEDEFFLNFYHPKTPQKVLDFLPQPKILKESLLKKSQAIPGMKSLFLELSAYQREKPDQFALGIASNYSHWSQAILKQCEWLTEAQYLFFSYQLRKRKPQYDYFCTIEQQLKRKFPSLSGKDILFFDDRQINIEGAQRLGWQTCLFQPSADGVKNGALAHRQICNFLGFDFRRFS